MKFDFTDGEWKYVKTGKHWNNKNLENIEIQYGNDGECICDTVYKEDDARLISCAPEMLKIIIALKKLYDKEMPVVFKNITRDIIEKATDKKWEDIWNYMS